MSEMFSCSNFLWMEPPDSSAARMPFGFRTRFEAINSRLLSELWAPRRDFSCSNVRAESILE